MSYLRWMLWVMLVGLVGLVGCEEEPVRVYRVAKPVAPPATTSTTAIEAPEGWQRAANSSPMIRDTFVTPTIAGIEGATVTVVSLPGDAGGDLANINRWRRQLGLPPVESIDDGSVARFELRSGASAKLVDLIAAEGDPGAQRMVAAWHQQGGTSWFFKMMGTALVVQGELERFRQFVATYGAKNAGGPG